MSDKHGDEPVTNEDLDEALAIHSKEEMAAITALIEELKQAFPDGIDNHRRAHEKMIKAAEAEERFWTDLKADIAKKSIWGILQILLTLLVVGLAAKFGLSGILAALGVGK